MDLTHSFGALRAFAKTLAPAAVTDVEDSDDTKAAKGSHEAESKTYHLFKRRSEKKHAA